MTAQDLIYAAMALQVLDVLSTLAAFHNGGYERNKVMRRIMGAIGTVPGLLLPKLIYAAPVWYYRDQFQAWGVWLVIAAYTVVVVNNIRIYCKKTGAA